MKDNESTNKILPVQDVCEFLYLCDLENFSVLLLHRDEEIYEKDIILQIRYSKVKIKFRLEFFILG